MLRRSVPAFQCELAPSRLLARWLAVVHGLAAVAVLLTPLPAGMRLAVITGIGGHLWLSFHRWVRGPDVVGIAVASDGRWTLRLRDGATIRIALLNTTAVTRWFVLLHWRCGDAKAAALVCRDSMDAESFRRLRVLLTVVGGENRP